jgi:hypothetical protein
MYYMYNVGDKGPSSMRISSPAASSAPFPHVIQNYLSDDGLSRQTATAGRGEEGEDSEGYEGLAEVAMGHSRPGVRGALF